jgi:hypothetical protein
MKYEHANEYITSHQLLPIKILNYNYNTNILYSINRTLKAKQNTLSNYKLYDHLIMKSILDILLKQ